MRRAALIVLGILALIPGTAAAHSGETGGTDYRTDILSVPVGVEVSSVGGDDRLAVTRTGAQEVVVLGYGGEPYLRLDGEGIWQNRRSPAVALNEERQPEEPLTGADGTPDWVLLAAGADTAIFHDHRAHWMGSTAPASVRADPDREQLLFEWDVPLIVDGERVAITGDARWMGRPRTGLWWAATAIAAIAAAAVGLLARRGAVALAALGAALAVAAGVAVGVSQQLDLPDPGGGVLAAAAITGGIVVATGIAAWLVRRTEAHVTSVLLLAAVVAGTLQLLPAAGPAFGYAFVPGSLPTLLVRLAIVVGIAGAALAAGACARSWHDLLAPQTGHRDRAAGSAAW